MLALLFIDGIHRRFVELLRLIEDSGILADGIVDFSDAVAKSPSQSQMPFDTCFRQKVEAVNHIVFAPDTVNPPEPLDEPHGIPVEVVINNFVAIL